jgi:hypothetical protein
MAYVSPAGGQTLGVDVNIGIDQEARAEIEAVRKTLAESLLTLADAIPGARYTRLIEDLNGPDTQKKLTAQTFLKNLAGLDPQVEYDASVWFEFNPSKPLHALVRRAVLSSPDEIVSRYKVGNITNAPEVTSTPLAGPRPEEIRQEIRQSLSAAIGKLQAGAQADTFDLNIDPSRPATTIPNPEPGKARAQMVDSLLGAFDAFYRDWTLPLQATVVTMPWPIFDERQALFVLIPESDWQAHGGNIAVRVLIHKKGDPRSPLPGAELVTFEKDEWKLIQLRDNQQPSRDFRWAVHTMTDALLISPETATKLKAYHDALVAYDKARTDLKQ